MTSKNTSRKVLVPLATMLAAGAIAVGSGASFTSTTSNSISAVTAGTLTQDNSKDAAAIFTIPNMKPGDTVDASLTLTNTGSLPANFTLKEPTSANAFTADKLKLTITDTTGGGAAQVWTGNFGAILNTDTLALGEFAAGEARTYEFKVHLESSTGNGDQGKTASATYTWDAVQTAGETTTQ